MGRARGGEAETRSEGSPAAAAEAALGGAAPGGAADPPSVDELRALQRRLAQASARATRVVVVVVGAAAEVARCPRQAKDLLVSNRAIL